MRNVTFVTSVVCIIACLSICTTFVLAGGGKYSQENNQKWDRDDLSGSKQSAAKDKVAKPEKAKKNEDSDVKRPTGPFRIAKMNAIWEKAQRRLSADDLRFLLDELQLQDKDEVTLKRLHHEGGDKDGSVAAELRDRLHMTMDKYGLLRLKENDNLKTDKKEKRDTTSGKGSTTPKRLIFKDKKLNKLWEKAQRAGFSEEELQNLKTEFTHHREKLDDYYEMFDEKTKNAENKKPEVDDSDYQIKDQWNDLSSELTEAELEDQVPTPLDSPPEETVQLDKKLKDITKTYGNLKDRVNKHSQNLDEFDFKEGRVDELWNQALDAGFDRTELLSLRNELQHFEHKLQKLKNFNDEIHPEGGKKHPTSMGKGGEKSPERLDWESKAKHYAQKTEKLEKEIQRRIENRRNEL